MSERTKVAIIGSGNIGTDLMIKIMRNGVGTQMGAMIGVDPASEGLARAARLGIPTTAEGLEGARKLPVWDEIGIVFDATSAKAHEAHAPILAADGKIAIDLTPAAIGPYVVPSVNLDKNLDCMNVNMVTCGGQATIPMVAALSRVARVPYAEIVATIASKSAGPGTRANIDEFTETTSQAIRQVGGAEHGKAIIILNPADPPLMMRDTVLGLVETTDRDAILRSVAAMEKEVKAYVPGYHLKREVQFEEVAADRPVRVAGKVFTGMKVSIFIEVEGAAHYLPAYAGNLDIMTSSALRTAERMVELRLQKARRYG